MAADKPVRVATRGSLLARTQTEQTLALLGERCPGVTFEMVIITTAGDVQNQGALPRSGVGYFTREIEEALLDRRADMAVHSLKDLPICLPAGLVIGAIPAREDARDVVVGRHPGSAPGVRVGTCSLRRAAQVRACYPGCEIVPLRGNLDTRLRKVKDGTVDGAVLAAAGLCRLGMEALIDLFLDPVDVVPAPAQGALGIEIRAGDSATAALVRSIHCPQTAGRVTAERAFMERLGGGCHLPVGAYAIVEDGQLLLAGRVAAADGRDMVDGRLDGPAERAADIGRGLAERLLAQGAREILDAIERAAGGEADGM